MSSTPACATPTRDDFRAGFCTLTGLANVGKSTLLNALVGEKLSIVNPKAQTTRRRVLGIYSDDRHQAVFVDTPGLLEPRYPLQEAMRREAEAALEGPDLLVYVVDAGYPPSVQGGLAFPIPETTPALLCHNKVDRIGSEERESQRDAFEAAGWAAVRATVASRGKGVDALREDILSRLPPSPPYYPLAELAAAPLRFFAAELVRETCFEELEEEVPYSIAVEVDAFRESETPVYISAIVYVERSSQKGIVIGEGGRMIRRIGVSARSKIERFIERRIYLDLRVKVLPRWRKRRGSLARLGFQLPPERG